MGSVRVVQVVSHDPAKFPPGLEDAVYRTLRESPENSLGMIRVFCSTPLGCGFGFESWSGEGMMKILTDEVIRRPAGRDLPGIELPHLCDMIRACSHSCRCLYTGEENRHGRVHRVL